MFCEILDMEEKEVITARKWLSKKGYATCIDGDYFVSDEGVELVRSCIQHPELNHGKFLDDWNDEVLTGTVETFNKKNGRWITEQSEIDTAVLPKTQGTILVIMKKIYS